MNRVKIQIQRDFQIGAIDQQMFGSFVEHMGSVVYNGIYEPGHPAADNSGFRKDVFDLVDDLNLSVIRYPGGNYSSNYDWEDTVGPVGDRPAKIDLAWRQIEPNTFGFDEFMKWISGLGAEPIMTVNLGTKGIQDAVNLIEYTNFTKGTKYSDLRRKHGREIPYGIKTWCLGNELDGQWQIARKAAGEYGRLARETGKAMKIVDPNIKLVAVGSSATHLDTYPDWDLQVLEETYEIADYISVHHYIDQNGDDLPTYLARANDVEEQIITIIAACDYVKALKRSKKTMMLSFDEWNIHRTPDVIYEPWTTGSPLDWCRFNMADALVFGSMMMTLLRHADRIKIACQSLLVNTIPLILTEKGGDAWPNPTYWIMQQASKYGRGTALSTIISSPEYITEKYGKVLFVDHIAVLGESDNEITVFLVNRSPEVLDTEIQVDGFLKPPCEVTHTEMHHPDLSATNTGKNDINLKIEQSRHNPTVSENKVVCTLQPYSWNMVRILLN